MPLNPYLQESWQLFITKWFVTKNHFNPVDLKQYQEKYKAAKISYLERKLAQLKKAA